MEATGQRGSSIPERMLIEVTITYMEMNSPDQLVPGRVPSAPLEMQKLDPASAPLFRSTYGRIASPHDWRSRSDWSDEAWEKLLSRQDVHAWSARMDDEVAGLLELEAQPGGDVEIGIFGLVPEFLGKGLGGHFLTLATRLAWDLTAPDGTATTRVWLHTSSWDHPHAKRNYERRGFRPFRTEQRERQIPGC